MGPADSVGPSVQIYGRTDAKVPLPVKSGELQVLRGCGPRVLLRRAPHPLFGAAEKTPGTLLYEILKSRSSLLLTRSCCQIGRPGMQTPRAIALSSARCLY